MKHKVEFQKQLIRIGERLAELRRQKGYTSHETFAYDYEIQGCNIGASKKEEQTLPSKACTACWKYTK